MYVLISCNTWKSQLQANGSNETVVLNAIFDFCHTSFPVKKEKIFAVDIMEINNNVVGVSILANPEPFIIIDGDTSNLPSQLIEYQEKLFYWFDEESKVNDQVIAVLNQYDMIDSVKSIAFANIQINHSIKAIDYYFCKEDLTKYKKVKSDQIIGEYTPGFIHLVCN
ncbi:MAG: hypothetical protein AAFN93_11460 [Bacteroidota bacterium]